MPIDDLDTGAVLAVVLTVVYAVSLVTAVGFFEGTLTVGESSYMLSEHAALAGLASLGGLAVLGGRQISNMETWEIGAVALGGAGVASAQYLDQVAEVIAENDPHAGIVVVTAGVVAAYIVGLKEAV